MRKSFLKVPFSKFSSKTELEQLIMNVTIKTFVRNFISVIIIAGLGYYLWTHWDIFYAALDASWHHILGLVLCIILTFMLNSCQVLLLFRKLGVKIGFWENVFVLIAMILGNHLPMRAGSLIRMRYFKKVHGLEYVKFTSTIAVRTLILLSTTGFLGCIGMIGLKLSGSPFNVVLLCILISMVVISLTVCLIPAPKIVKPKNVFLKVWSDFLTGFDTIQSHPTLLLQIVGLVLMQFAVLAIRLYISFDAIQVELSPWIFLILAPMTSLISFLSLTPGNLGLREWAIGIISLASGVDFSSGIFAGTLDRAVLMACTFIFGSGSLVYVWIRIKNATSKDHGVQSVQ